MIARWVDANKWLERIAVLGNIWELYWGEFQQLDRRGIRQWLNSLRNGW